MSRKTRQGRIWINQTRISGTELGFLVPKSSRDTSRNYEKAPSLNVTNVGIGHGHRLGTEDITQVGKGT